MKKLLGIILALGLFFNSRVFVEAASEYVIDNFESKIVLEEKGTLLIEERIEANFMVAKRGIIRAIPWQYSARGRSISSNLRVLGVKNEAGKSWNYQIGREGQDVTIKIGEEDKYLKGKQIYVITYRVEDVVLDYGEGPEIYWNVTGHEWDAPIMKTKARLVSEYGKIEKIECFSGVYESEGKNCKGENSEKEAIFESLGVLGQGKELTVVAQISKENSLVEASQIEKIGKIIRDNWGYLAALIPLLVMGYMWWKKGRDRRFLNDNVFYVQEGAEERSTKLFEREMLSTVYQKIEGLSPLEVGMIIDEKVDLNDIVAEIVDLARRGFLTIEKIEKKGLFGKVDYKMIGSDKGEGKLEEYQIKILSSIFESVTVKEEVSESSENGKKTKSSKRNSVTVSGEKKISELKNSFYVNIPKIVEGAEKSLVEKKCFAEKISKTRTKWVAVAMGVNGGVGALIFWFLANTYNPGPLFLWIFLAIPSFMFASKMVAKTAVGYNYYRQAASLKWFIERGKWREEIAEKKLFLGEVLPLAIALGVVKKLAKEMEGLGIGAPEYVGGNAMLLSRDLDLFRAGAVSAMAASPQGNSNYSVSGRSSWSGGSGFSGGGSSGGGFGGGGGSSW